MKPPSSKPLHHKTGFTLVELAIVLVIVALLASGLMVGIAAQRNAAENIDAQRQLENIRETLTGFALTHGRLPCPALPNLASSDANAGVENCAQPDGVLPWVTLGLPEVDPWGRRFTYYAHANFTAAVPGGALASFTLDTLGNANVKASSGSSGNVASDLPAVVVSHGSRGAGAWQSNGSQLPGAAGDEAENADADLTFISRTQDGAFDDLVTWIVPSILKSKMVAAGRLP
ncbi:MAG: type II secretion system protein [Dechloromonas sp.]|nr:MAG: type II secretion system protein [Dechloromonas sp.]